ncbi:hypothetical protein AK812_SmicGene22054 [Symbiodinium microadriaticum]|uniref:Uncharacterized protein n=1 Tax=Symbiodinium microadriaticum TaxID=2951 RepID=A0A1Q9DKU3_SYMMI|nr:hypothetical protein AK812_SmicGene22054 [Symbiodinium microadriaticum]
MELLAVVSAAVPHAVHLLGHSECSATFTVWARESISPGLQMARQLSIRCVRRNLPLYRWEQVANSADEDVVGGVARKRSATSSGWQGQFCGTLTPAFLLGAVFIPALAGQRYFQLAATPKEYGFEGLQHAEDAGGGGSELISRRLQLEAVLPDMPVQETLLLSSVSSRAAPSLGALSRPRCDGSRRADFVFEYGLGGIVSSGF